MDIASEKGFTVIHVASLEYTSVNHPLQQRDGSKIATRGDACWACSEILPRLLQLEK